MDGSLFAWFIVSHHHVKIGENKDSSSEDIIILICHMKEQRDFISRSLLR